jgi:hypothetical protein
MPSLAFECTSSTLYRSQRRQGLGFRSFQFCTPKIEVGIGCMMLLSRDKKSEKNVPRNAATRLELLDAAEGLSNRSGTGGRFAYGAR